MKKTAVRESHVRDSLSACLDKLENGLLFLEKESKLPSSIGTTGFIDLLAQDADKRYVLVEVKKTEAATRETLHEVLKYIENAKTHLGLRENELRVIVASVEWRELLIPFSSFVQRTACRVDGYQLHIDNEGNIVAADVVLPLPIQSDRILAPWHELRFYETPQKLAEGIASYEAANAAKALTSYVLVILDAPVSHPEGFPSTKQITNRGMLAEIALSMGNHVKNEPPPLYSNAIYFAMQQLSRDEYISRLPNDADETAEIIKNILELDEEDALASLHEAMLDTQPRASGDYLEIGYPAKFRARLLDEEGWQIREILRYGAFQRNSMLTDETIIDEICGSQGNSKQFMKMSFRPDQKSEVAEVRRRVNECLADNDPWRSQINFCLDELSKSGESRTSYIQISNPSSAITTVYLVASREDGILYIPTYQIRVPENDTEYMYHGVLQHNGSKPKSLNQIVDEFYEGNINLLLFTLQWGGYESRDVNITRRLGLRYRTFLTKVNDVIRTCYALDNHEWEECDPIDGISSYFSFLNEQEKFTREVYDLYSSRWDGNVVRYGDFD